MQGAVPKEGVKEVDLAGLHSVDPLDMNCVYL